MVYYYDRDSDPCLYSFDSDIPVGIYPGLSIKINDLLMNLAHPDADALHAIQEKYFVKESLKSATFKFCEVQPYS